MTLDLVPWRGQNVPLLNRDEIARYNISDYINWINQAQMYGWQPPITTTYGSRPAEPISYNFQGFVEGMLYADGPVAAAEQYRLRVFGQAPLLYQELMDGRPGDLFDDKNLNRIRAPWPGATLSDLMKRTLIYGDLAGNGFVLDLEDELVLVRPDWVEIVLEKRMYRGFQVGWKQVGIMYYEGGLGVGEGVPFLPGEYAHFVPGLPDPLAAYRGMSWLTPLIREVQADKAAMQHKLAYFENSASVNLAVSLPKELTPDQFNAFVDAMDARHKGAQNAGKTLYTGGGADVTVIGSNMQQADFASIIGKGETRVANAAGVPPVLLSFSEGMQGSSLNAGNYTAAKRNFVDTTMRDLWANFAGSIQQMDYFQSPMPKTRLWYDGRDIPFLHEDANDIATRQQTQASALSSMVTNGWVPETARNWLEHDDLGQLKHSGAFSVQLQPPGAGPDGTMAPPPELQNFDFGSLREGVGNTGSDAGTETAPVERARYDVRFDKGTQGGGRFRKLSDVAIPLLKEWANGKGDRDPLAKYNRDQLRRIAKDVADHARQAGDHERAARLTPRRGASAEEIKYALYDDARGGSKAKGLGIPTTGREASDHHPGPDSPRYKPTAREMDFYEALEAGDRDSAVDAAEAEMRELHGRELTGDEMDRLERNVDAALKRRERKAGTPQGQQPGSAAQPQPEASQASRYERYVDANDRMGAVQSRVDDFRANLGRSPDPEEYRELKREVDEDFARRERRASAPTPTPVPAATPAAADDYRGRIVDRSGTPDETLQAEDELKAKSLEAPPLKMQELEALTPNNDTVRALRYYQHFGDQHMNGLLRHGKVGAPPLVPESKLPAPSKVQRSIEALDAAMLQSRLTEPMVTYRGVSEVGLMFPGGDAPGSLVGREFRDPGFTSTSADRWVAEDFMVGEASRADGALMTVIVPPGIGAIQISNDDYKGSGAKPAWESEREILLQRGLRYRIVADEQIPSVYRSRVTGEAEAQDQPVRHLVVEVVPA